MSEMEHRKLVVGYLQWSIVGAAVALLVMYATSDYRLVVYGLPGGEVEVLDTTMPNPSFDPLPFVAPASAPHNLGSGGLETGVSGVRDTGLKPGRTREEEWADPWDQIGEDLGLRY